MRKKFFEVRFVEVINRKHRRYVYATDEDEAIELVMSGYGCAAKDSEDEIIDDEDWEVTLIDG